MKSWYAETDESLRTQRFRILIHEKCPSSVYDFFGNEKEDVNM